MKKTIIYIAATAAVIAGIVGYVSSPAAQRGGGDAEVAADTNPFAADLVASYGSDVYTEFLYDDRMTPHLRSVHRLYMSRAFADAGEFELAEEILDRITTYEELPGNAPVHLRAEEMQIRVREMMALAAGDPDERRRIYRPLIYYALGRIRAFPDPETRRSIATIGLRAARHNENQDAIDRFNRILEGLEK